MNVIENYKKEIIDIYISSFFVNDLYIKILVCSV